jgi:hypothetical protein
MNVIDLNGNLVKWNPSSKARATASKLHKTAVSIINDMFPTINVLEEVTIPGRGNKLYIDIYIPIFNLAIEVNGRQHYNFVPYFHRTRFDFLKQKERDRIKREWCETNNIKILDLKYGEEDEWETKIKQSLNG